MPAEDEDNSPWELDGFPRPVKAIPLRDQVAEVHWENGKVFTVDFGPWICSHKNRLIRKYVKWEEFKRLELLYGAFHWENDITLPIWLVYNKNFFPTTEEARD